MACTCGGQVCEWKLLLEEMQNIITRMQETCEAIKHLISHHDWYRTEYAPTMRNGKQGYIEWRKDCAIPQMKRQCDLLQEQNQKCEEVLAKLEKLSACTEERRKDLQSASKDLATHLLERTRFCPDCAYEDTATLNCYSWRVHHSLGFCVMDMKKKPQCGFWFVTSLR